MLKFVALAVLLVLAEALENFGHHHDLSHEQHHAQDHYAEPHYNFVYEVKDLHTHDIKSHKEERKGDHTQGVYYLVEPDGSKRTVEYHVVGKSGFNAVVHREPNKHPNTLHKSGYHDAAGGLSSYSTGYKAAGESSSYSAGYKAAGDLSSYSAGYKAAGGLSSYSADYNDAGDLSSYSAGYKAAGYSAGKEASSFAALSKKVSSAASSGHHHTLSYSSLDGANNLHGYKSFPASAASGDHSDAHGAATSSVKFNVHGAHHDATIQHVVPVKHHY
ncbi:uncharacterized protein [Rhodnius prolixus]|uniref:Putative cuticle protein n=1 Tax=Rhodnius prolixus TaxID=13249 RepID=R4FJE0_RHOPR